MLGILLQSCTESPAPGPATGADPQSPVIALRRGLGGEPATLDPHRAIDSFSLAVLRDLFEGLVTEDERGRIVPGAAESWDVSSDGLVYTFRLRDGLRWSNGDALTALDYAAGLQRTLDPATSAPGADFLDGIQRDGVNAPDDRTLVIRLARPVAHLIKVLATPAAAPLHRGSRAGDGPHLVAAERLVSNGAYQLEAWRPGAAVVLTRNAYYREAASVAFARVEYHPFADANAELARYRAGDLDMTWSLPQQDSDRMRSEFASELQLAPFLSVFYYAFDLTGPPFRGNRQLREALAMALDRELLADRVAGFGAQPAHGFVPPGIDDYDPQSWKWRDWDRERRIELARERYAAAGYGPDRPLRVTLLYHTNDAIRRMTVAVAAMWRETLGVETTLVAEEFRSFLVSRNDRTRWDLLRMGWNADYDDALNFLAIFRTGGRNNDTGYANPAYDHLLDRAAVESDGRRRAELLQQAERLLLADFVVVPVYFQVTRRLVKPHLEGPLPTPMNRSYSKHWRPATPADNRGDS